MSYKLVISLLILIKTPPQSLPEVNKLYSNLNPNLTYLVKFIRPLTLVRYLFMGLVACFHRVQSRMVLFQQLTNEK